MSSIVLILKGKHTKIMGNMGDKGQDILCTIASTYLVLSNEYCMQWARILKKYIKCIKSTF